MAAPETKEKSTGSGAAKTTILHGLGRSIFLLSFVLSVIPLIIVSWISYNTAYNNLRSDAILALTSSIQAKKQQIQIYFQERLNDLAMQADLQPNIQLLEDLKQGVEKSTLSPAAFVKTFEWVAMAADQGEDLSNFRQSQDYYDIFLIDLNGNVLYSVMAGDYLGSNVISGTAADNELGKACRLALKRGLPSSSDLEFFSGDNTSLSLFLVQVMENDFGDIIGFMAFQVPVQQVNEVMHADIGLGNSGQTYLLGTDLLMRSNSRLSKESTVMKQRVDTELSARWLAEWKDKHAQGKSEAAQQAFTYKSYNQAEVLGAASRLEVLHELGLNWLVVAEVDEAEAFSSAAHLQRIMAAMLSLTVLLVFILAVAATRRIVLPIQAISIWARQVANGDLSYYQITTPKNEIGELKSNFAKMVESLQAVSKVCESIAVGDFEQSVEVRSAQDVLAISVNQMAHNLWAVVQQADSVAQGNYSTEIRPHSTRDKLGLALNNMTTQLSRMSHEQRRDSWFKNGQAEIAELMRGTRNVADLSRDIIVYIAEFFGAQIGAFYLSGANEDLNLAASYAFTRRQNKRTTFRPGEGLVGEAALDRKHIIVNDVPKDYIRIDSGLGHTQPRHIMLFPFFLEDKIIGVIELGALHPFADQHLEFLQQTSEAIAIAIHAAQVAQQTRELLEQTQQQTEELQSQQEELQASNEELREQTEALQKSETQLQLQQEELQVINEELAERTNTLEKQQEEVKQKNEELARHRNELIQKASELEATTKYKSEFLANMSHELRTPLNSILILSQLFMTNKEGNFSEKQLKYAQTINSSGTELLTLINEVLDLSKIEAGRVQLDIGPLDLRQFLAEMEQDFTPVAVDRGVEMITELGDGLPAAISSDQQKLRQIIKNFLSNAFKFTAKGRVCLQISRPATDMDLGTLLPATTIAINVIDTGIGIAQDKQKVIFEAFQQVDGSISRKYGGTGLGLSIAREFTNLLGGEIRLSSEAGQGSTFTILLPEEPPLKPKTAEVTLVREKPEIEVEPGAPSNQAVAKPVIDESVDDDRKNLGPDDKVLLIIEDDPAFVSVLVDLAHERNFKCIVAEDGESGIHYADYYQPGAIILDIGLPGIDGWQVMHRLKKNQKTSHIPIHFMSAADQVIKARQKGAIGFLSKPVSIEKIQGALGLIEEKIYSTVKYLLIVEDHHDQRSSMVELVSAPHINITAVATGKEAWQLLKKKSFDCMIIDLGLQDMSGFELLQMINEDNAVSTLPIIIYTGRELKHEEEEKLRRYSDSIIIKGVRSPERLLAETTLFLHQVEADLPEEKQQMLAAVHNRESIFEDKKVLVVDDDMRNVFALSSALEEKGMIVLAAENGRKGLDKLAANSDVAVVLMDIMMPEMDGFETMARIRSQPRYKKLPLIALTAKAMKGDRHKCIEAGANDYLAKPVDIDKLLSLLRVWLCQ